MIRPATEADIDRIVEFGERFYREAQWADITSFAKDDCRASIGNMIGNEAAILLVNEEEEVDGMIGGLLTPIYFNYAHKSGEELFWWVKPTAKGNVGLALLKALLSEAKDRGCKSFVMKSLDRVNADKMERLYRMLGFRATEHSYMKRL